MIQILFHFSEIFLELDAKRIYKTDLKKHHRKTEFYYLKLVTVLCPILKDTDILSIEFKPNHVIQRKTWHISSINSMVLGFVEHKGSTALWPKLANLPRGFLKIVLAFLCIDLYALEETKKSWYCV